MDDEHHYGMAHEAPTHRQRRVLDAPGTRHGRPIDYGIAEVERKVHPMSVVSLMLGIIGFLIPVVPSLFAIIFGYAGRSRTRADPYLKGEGVATTGIILGWVALLLFTLAVVLVTLGVLVAQ